MINRSSKDNATSRETQKTQKTPNALVLNVSDIGQSVFLDLHLPFHAAFAKSALCIYWCLLPTDTKSILNYVTISVIWSSVSSIYVQTT